MRYLYYYVPPCPKCGSEKTGRYVRQPRREEDARYMMEQSLKYGELIRFTFAEPFNNAFCEDCGHEWPQTISSRRMSKQEIMRSAKNKDTASRYAKFMQEHPKKKRSILSRIFGFLP